MSDPTGGSSSSSNLFTGGGFTTGLNDSANGLNRLNHSMTLDPKGKGKIEGRNSSTEGRNSSSELKSGTLRKTSLVAGEAFILKNPENLKKTQSLPIKLWNRLIKSPTSSSSSNEPQSSSNLISDTETALLKAATSSNPKIKKNASEKVADLMSFWRDFTDTNKTMGDFLESEESHVNTILNLVLKKIDLILYIIIII